MKIDDYVETLLALEGRRYIYCDPHKGYRCWHGRDCEGSLVAIVHVEYPKIFLVVCELHYPAFIQDGWKKYEDQ